MWFNEWERYPAAWLRNLWPGATVDERSIADLEATDIPAGRCHFFAGIGGWEYALELAGWPAEREVWTGSCPCQPFSAAGKRKGVEDERHLWPAWFRLIAERRPATVFGEQVTSRLGREWLAGVRADLESLGYAVGAADLCAASVGAPHTRQRLWWVAYAGSSGFPARGNRGRDSAAQEMADMRVTNGGGNLGGLGHADDDGCSGSGQSQPTGIEGTRREQPDGPIDRASTAAGGVAYAEGDGREQGRAESIRREPAERRESRMEHADEQRREAGRGDAAGWLTEPIWTRAIWHTCSDGKARRIESGIRPLAHGIPNRVGKLRAYGNAIVPQVAALFVRAFMEAES